VLLRDLSEEAVGELLAAIGPAPESANLMIQLRHLGGAMARREEGTTAIGDRRHAKYVLYFLGIPMPHNPVERLTGQAEGVFEALAPWVLSRGPLNWLGEGHVKSSEIRAVYSDCDYERLVRVKDTYDPTNVFRHAGIGICQAEN
jgi:hypothetical protein